MPNKSYTIISDLLKKKDIEDDNLIIVEDNEDTKQATVLEFKKCLSGDYNDPSDKKFYSSQKIEDIIDNIKRQLSSFATEKSLNSIQKRIEDIITESGTGKDSELIEARNGFKTLNSRLLNDTEIADNKYMEKVTKTIEGTQYISTENIGFIDMYLKSTSESSNDIVTFTSKNILNSKSHVLITYNGNNNVVNSHGESKISDIIITTNKEDLVGTTVVMHYNGSPEYGYSDVEETITITEDMIDVADNVIVVTLPGYIFGTVFDEEADQEFEINNSACSLIVYTSNTEESDAGIYIEHTGNSGYPKSIKYGDGPNVNTIQVTYTDTGFIFSEIDENDLSVTLKLDSSIPKGEYFFFTDIEYGTLFKDKSVITFAINNSKDTSAYAEFEYNQDNRFKFEASKAFDEIKIIFNKDNFVSNSSIEFKNIMLLSSEKYADSYIPYEKFTMFVEKGISYNLYNNNYNISCSKGNILVVEYHDNNITANTMQDTINELKAATIDNRDKCGLIEDYGKYLFFDNVICETPTSCRLSYDSDKFMRNGVSTLSTTFSEKVEINPVLSVELTENIETVDSVSLVFYIDKTVTELFTTEYPIVIQLCSDYYREPEMVNYFTIKLNKNEFVQGWNIIKKNINEFTAVGTPNEHSIKYTKIEIVKNSELDNQTIYFNSLVFNQKMKPIVLLAFDGIYDEGFGNKGKYPYYNDLVAKNIPATIFSSNSTTFGKTMLNSILNLRAKYGWDLGQYGCNPDKESLQNDDNPREQYLALKSTKENWLQSNLIYNPVSYSAPYGDLRPITVPLLKDLGYKIAKTESTGYCSFFDPKYDFAIPMTIMINKTSIDDITSKINYAIENNCCICLYANNVTEYGDEEGQQDAKNSLLQGVISHIIANRDKITPMTFSEFYNKCNL